MIAPSYQTSTNGQRRTNYVYTDETNTPIYRIIRTQTPNGKTFSQESAKDDDWHSGKGCMDGIRRVVYKLPAVAFAVAQDHRIVIVEGEKDVERLAELGITATTNEGGANNWRESHSECLRGARVVIIPDNDDAGERHANKVARALEGIAKSVQICRLPNLPPRGDVSDWLDAGNTPFDLIRRLNDAPVIAQPAETPAPPPVHKESALGMSRIDIPYTKQLIEQSFDLVAWFCREFNAETRREGREIRILENGGLIVDPDNRRWYSFSGEGGGHWPEAIAFTRNLQTTGKDFIEIIKIAADFAGIAIQYETPERPYTSAFQPYRPVDPKPYPLHLKERPLPFCHADILHMFIKPLDWLIPGILPRNALSQLFAPGGTGKSLLALDMALTVAQEAPVLYVCGEAPNEMIDRIAAWNTHYQHGNGQLYVWYEPVAFADPLAVEQLAAAAASINAEFIVIDPLASMLLGLEESSTGDMQRAVASLNIIRKTTEAAVLVVHHTGWSESHERGSSVLRAACRAVFKLAEAGDGLISLTSEKCNNGKPFEKLFFRIITAGESAVIAPASKVLAVPKLTAHGIEILEALSLSQHQHSGASFMSIIEATGLAKSTLHRQISSLINLGYIEKDGSSRGSLYCITEKGTEALAAVLAGPKQTSQNQANNNAQLNWKVVPVVPESSTDAWNSETSAEPEPYRGITAEELAAIRDHFMASGCHLDPDTLETSPNLARSAEAQAVETKPEPARNLAETSAELEKGQIGFSAAESLVPTISHPVPSNGTSAGLAGSTDAQMVETQAELARNLSGTSAELERGQSGFSASESLVPTVSRPVPSNGTSAGLARSVEVQVQGTKPELVRNLPETSPELERDQVGFTASESLVPLNLLVPPENGTCSTPSGTNCSPSFQAEISLETLSSPLFQPSSAEVPPSRPVVPPAPPSKGAGERNNETKQPEQQALLASRDQIETDVSATTNGKPLSVGRGIALRLSRRNELMEQYEALTGEPPPGAWTLDELEAQIALVHEHLRE